MHPDIPEPLIIVKPIINYVGDGSAGVLPPVQSGDWCIMGYAFVLGACCLVIIAQAAKTWATGPYHIWTRETVDGHWKEEHILLHFRTTCLILFCAFVFEGFSYWFYTNYSSTMRFVADNLFFMGVSMALFHNSFTNFPREHNNTIGKNCWVYWALSAAIAIIWLFVGQNRLGNNVWLSWAFNLCWSSLMGFAVLMGQINHKKHHNLNKDCSDDIRKSYDFWARLMFAVLFMRVF